MLDLRQWRWRRAAEGKSPTLRAPSLVSFAPSPVFGYTKFILAFKNTEPALPQGALVKASFELNGTDVFAVYASPEAESITINLFPFAVGQLALSYSMDGVNCSSVYRQVILPLSFDWSLGSVGYSSPVSRDLGSITRPSCHTQLLGTLTDEL